MQPNAPASSATFAARLLGRERLARIADGLAIALAVSLPWSTSATSILSVLWIVAVLPALDRSRLRDIVLSPAGGLPIVFTLLAILGVLWSQAPVAERFASVVPFARMLVIPLLLWQFSQSPRGAYLIYGFIASCAVLLAASYWSYMAGDSGWYPFRANVRGVPVKNYIDQAGLFTICAFALLEIATGLWPLRRRLAVALFALAAAFLSDIALVATSRTAILVIAVLLVLFALRRPNWTIRAAVLGLGIVLAGIAWVSSDYLRQRVIGVFTEIKLYQTENKVTSAGERLAMWSNSIKLVAQAPILGYGTGANAATFKDASRDSKSLIPNADNPHNQTFAVAIQLGLVGVAVLYAMWLAHLLLFRGSGWEAWFGIVVVVHSAVGSLVNSYLFDFTPGWAYAVCVGVTGGMILRRKSGDLTR